MKLHANCRSQKIYFVGNGQFATGSLGFDRPLDIAMAMPMDVSINRSGTPYGAWLKLVFSDYLLHSIRGLTSDNQIYQIAVGDGDACAPFGENNNVMCVRYPMGVTTVGNVRSLPSLYVADRGDNTILDYQAYSTSGGSGRALFSGPGFLDAIDPLAKLPTGTAWRPVAVATVEVDRGLGPVNQNLAYGLYAKDRSDLVERVPTFFFADLSNHAVRHGDVNGLLQTVAGNGAPGDSGDGGPAYLAQFIAPSALAQSKDGTLYVADAEANRIRRISCADVDRCTSTATFNGTSCTYTPTSLPVNDGNDCTYDACIWPVGDTHQAYPDATPRSCNEDGNLCNGSGSCVGTTCVVSAALPAGASCSDQNACNGDEVCTSAQTCVASSFPNIDDANPCTADACTPSGGITHTSVSNGTACTSNDPCRNPGTCVSGACSTTAVTLDQSNPCVTESCNSTAGVVRTFNSGTCPGGTCSNGVCVPSGGVSAGALGATVPPSSAAIFGAIYAAETGVQTGADVGPGTDQLNPDHGAHLFGTVALSDGSSSKGVKVVVLNHPEAGETLVRADGKFDIVANGGGQVVLRFTKNGFLPADRQAAPSWGGGAHIDDLTMVKLDGAATTIASNSSAFQDAAGTVTTAVQDSRGARQARVIFPPNTTATAISLDEAGGSTTALNSTLTVRATEFTAGTSATALRRMPAPLPGSSLYTYAVDFSVDEAPNAASVVFNQPVFAYLDNFLGMPTGAPVPDGYYDRNKAAWVPEDNGIVMAIVGYDVNGAAVIDLTGDGQETSADAAVWNAIPANQRVTAGERALLAQRYPGATSSASRSLWRVPLTHFSVHDFNNGGGVACVGNKCPAFGGDLSGGYDPPADGSCARQGSIVDVEEQSLGEELPIMGTPFALNYKSSYTLGYLVPRGAEVDYNPGPNDLSGTFEVGLFTASGTWKYISPAPAKNYITWDGRDSSGRRVNGSQLATILATVVYPGDYRVTGRFGDPSSSTSVSQGYPMRVGTPPDVRYTRSFKKVLSAWGADALGFGGWTLSPMHVYDTTGHMLYQGDGRQRDLNSGRTVRLIAGNSYDTPSTGQATQTGIPSRYGFYFEEPVIAASSNGDLYYLSAESTRKEIRRVRDGAVADLVTLPSEWATIMGAAMAFSPDEKYLYVPTLTRILRVNMATRAVDVFAGTGVAGDNQTVAANELTTPANAAQFNQAVGIAVARDGTVYVTDEMLVRKIATDAVHTVSTIAGSRSGTVPCSNGLPARKVMLFGLATASSGVAVGPDDALWLGSGRDLIRIDPSGTATCFPQGVSQVNAGVAVGTDGTVYFAHDDVDSSSNASTSYSIRTLNPDGSSTIVAGGNGQGVPVDGASALSAQVARSRSMTVAPDGSLYFVNIVYPSPAQIFQVSPPPATGPSGCAIALPSEDGTQRFCFDKDGRHLSTRNALTGVTQLTFHYGTAGQLSDIVDADGNRTLVDTSANPVVITGPFGQTTKIYLDPATNYATAIEDAMQQRTNVSHDASGLLLSLTDRNNKVHRFSYDERGRLKRDQNPANGFQLLNRTDAANSYSVSDVTALGATQAYSVSVDSQGVETRMVTLADGSQNQSVRNRSGATTTTFADRSTLTTTTAVDPVTFKPYVTSATTQYPSGLSSTVGVTKSASATTITELLSLNGVQATKSFVIGTKTYTMTTPVSATSPTGRVSTLVVDDMNRATSVTPPGINAVSYQYDKGRLASVLQGSRKTELFYNDVTAPSAPGRLRRVKVTDGTGIISTLIVPDNAGRTLNSSTCAMDATDTSCVTTPIQTGFGWDPEGNLTSVTPPGRTSHAQSFTGTNLLESYTPPIVSDVPDPKTSFFYNLDGALDYVRQPGNRAIDYAYDSATGQLRSDGAATFTYIPREQTASAALQAN